MEIKFKISHQDYHNGQHEMILYAHHNNDVVGYIKYAEFENVPSIHMIKVLPEFNRRGIGTKMVRYLQKEYPETEIELGMLTSDGHKLISSMPTKEIPNGDIPDKIKRLKAIRKKLEDYEKKSKEIYNQKTSQDRKDELMASFDDWNDLHDEEYDLNQSIRGKKPTKRIFEHIITKDDRRACINALNAYNNIKEYSDRINYYDPELCPREFNIFKKTFLKEQHDKNNIG